MVPPQDAILCLLPGMYTHDPACEAIARGTFDPAWGGQVILAILFAIVFAFTI